MEKFEYDLAKLAEVEEMDVNGAVCAFGCQSTFFEALDAFVQNVPQYLRGYMATVVVHSDDMRQAFFAELEGIQCTLIKLGMLGLAAQLTELKEVIGRGAIKSSEDELLQFHACLEIVVRGVVAARIGARP